LAAAENANATITSYHHPLTGNDLKNPLACDVAVLGPEDADKALIIVSGTHGVEGYCGSAIQHAWLRQDFTQAWDETLKVVLVHAINPWAMQNNTRTNENNVDLNRNFASGEYGGSNAAYETLKPFFYCAKWDATENLRAFLDYRSFLAEQDNDLETQLYAGQFTDPRGLFYGGDEPQWSNITFRQIIKETLHSCRKIGIVDWHTGLGKFSEIVYLIFHKPNSIEGKEAGRWWGAEKIGRSPFQSGSLPNYRGLLCQSIRQELPSSEIINAVIEFGTGDELSGFRADRLDRWLRFHGASDPHRDQIAEDYKDMFFPRDISWRRLVEQEGVSIMNCAVEGLKNWI